MAKNPLLPRNPIMQPAVFPQHKPDVSKLGGNVSTNNAVASVAAPAPTISTAELATEIYTFFARPNPTGQFTIIYNGDRMFAQVILTLETAGPVAVSTKQQINPTLSGKGQLLETGVPLTFTLAKGQRLYVVTSSINRIKVTVQPYPWLEQFAGLLGMLAGLGKK